MTWSGMLYAPNEKKSTGGALGSVAGGLGTAGVCILDLPFNSIDGGIIDVVV